MGRFTDNLCLTKNEDQAGGDKVIVGLDASAVIKEEPDGLDSLVRDGDLCNLAFEIPDRYGDPPGTYEQSD